MPIDLNTAQAQKVAALAREMGGEVSLHQVTGGTDLYVGPAGTEQHRFLVSATGRAREVEQPPPAAEPG
jgi:hypothetical protein